MAGTGTIVNVVAIVAGTVLGTLVGHRLPAGVQERVLRGLGLVTVVIGIDLALQWRDTNLLFVLGGVLLGGIAGEAMRLEERLERLGHRIQARVAARAGEPGADGAASSPAARHATVSEGFVTASLLFCIGAMAVVGSVQDGISHDPDTLLTKAALDGFAAIALAASLGWGVGLSAVPVALYQGTLTALAGALAGTLAPGSDELLALTSAGGIMILAIGLKLLDVVDVKIGNFMPALVIAPMLAALTGAIT